MRAATGEVGVLRPLEVFGIDQPTLARPDPPLPAFFQALDHPLFGDADNTPRFGWG
jgi:hypothetical protein